MLNLRCRLILTCILRQEIRLFSLYLILDDFFDVFFCFLRFLLRFLCIVSRKLSLGAIEKLYFCFALELPCEVYILLGESQTSLQIYMIFKAIKHFNIYN